MERHMELGRKRDRTANYLDEQAIIGYLDQEEKRSRAYWLGFLHHSWRSLHR